MLDKLKEIGMSRPAALEMMEGRFKPTAPPVIDDRVEKILKEAKDENANIYSEIFKTKREYNSVFNALSDLSLYDEASLNPFDLEEDTYERLSKATGGEVSEPVPNAPLEPDERINKLTGLPYNEGAGTAYMDEDDPMRRMNMAAGGRVRKSEGGLGQDILSFIAQARGYKDPLFLKEYADDVKWQESRGAGPTTVQNNNGPAKGSYQVEGSEGSSRNETILNRAKNFYGEYPNAPKSKEIEYALSQRGKDLDFSTLSEKTQDALFYIDAERGNLPLDKLAKGELDSKTAWMEHWNQGPDRQVMEDKWDRAKQEQEILLRQQLIQ